MADAHDELLARLWQAVVDACGGPDAEAMTQAHYEHGRALSDIGAEYGLAASTVHHRIHRLRAHLATHGLLPPAWQRRDRGYVRQNPNKARTSSAHA